METATIQIESLYDKAEAYVSTNYELAKLRSTETAARVITSLVARMGVIIMISMFALVLNIGIALMLGDLLGKLYYGFFIVAAFYLIVGLVLYFFLHKWIKKPLNDLIISQALQ